MRRGFFSIAISCVILLSVFVGDVLRADEENLDLDATIESVYVPPGSAYNILGILFWELEINGGVELGNLYEKVLERKSNPSPGGVKPHLLVSIPGDPDYLSEFSAKQVTIREALQGYCKANKQLSWSIEDNMLNICSAGVKKRKRNPLDIVVEEIRFEQGASLWDCHTRLIMQLREPAAKMGVQIPDADSGHPGILLDYVNATNTVFLSRPKTYTKTSVRAILNDLVKPFGNVVWVSTFRGSDGDKDALFGFAFGSWRKKALDETADCVSELVDAIRFESMDGWDAPMLDGGSSRECKMRLYVKYKEESQGVMEALNEAIEAARNKEVRKELEEIREHLKGDFDTYAHYIVGVEH